MRNFILSLFALAFCSLGMSAQTCKSSQYDMLDWMAPQIGTVNGHFNVVFPSTGTFYWVKGASGFPWDVDRFDSKFIYQSVTEQVWNNPNTYKIFETPLPWMPRCIDIPKVPGRIASITVPPDATKFDVHSSCTSFITSNLGHVVSEVWGPSKQAFGTLPAAGTLTLSYRYSCDVNYSSCSDQETFAMQKTNGLVQWTHYHLQNGIYVKVSQTTQGAAQIGTITPVHPCW